jgi:peptidoglycan/xylan/chitin deacetylase (PgdA/CDA1 family)
MPRVVAVLAPLGRPLVAWVYDMLTRLSSAKLGVAVVYHRVAASPGNPERELLPAHGIRTLEAQLLHLRSRYRPVPASHLPREVALRRRGRRVPVAITFDDDLTSHVELAAPTLRSLGLPATFFLSGASLEAPHAFWWERLQTAVDRGVPLADLHRRLPAAVASGPSDLYGLGQRIEALTPDARRRFADELAALVGPDPDDAGLRSDHVRRLVDDGFEIGFHSLGHDPLPGLPDRELSAALREGRDRLEAITGRPLTVIAYPHGLADERVARAAASAGFACGYTTRGEAVSAGSDAHLLGRVEAHDPDPAFALRLARALRAARPRRRRS